MESRENTGQKEEMEVDACVSLIPALIQDASGNVRPPLSQYSGLSWAHSGSAVSSLAPSGLAAGMASCCC